MKPFTLADGLSFLRRAGLIIVIAGYLAVALFQVAVLPPFEGPDEQKHYAYARHLVNTRSLPTIGRSSEDVGYNYGIDQMSGNPPLYYALIALVTAPIPDADNVAAYVQRNIFAVGYDEFAAPFDNHVSFLHGREDKMPWAGPSLAVRAGRLVSVGLGLLTVLAAYGIGRALAPREALVGILAAALTGWLPQFVFISSVISTDNGVIAFSSLTIWIAMRILRDGPRRRLVVLGGLTAGLTCLCKINGAWVGGIVWLAIILASRNRPWTRVAGAVFLSLAVFAAVSGWWFARGAALRGDPLGISVHAYTDQPRFEIADGALQSLPFMLGTFESSLWYSPGWAAWIPAPGWLILTYRLIFGFGLLGWAGHVFAQLRRARKRAPGELDEGLTEFWQYACLLAAIALAFAGAVVWMLLYKWALGRLFFPALAALAGLVAIGIQSWFGLASRAALPARAKPAFTGLLAVALGVNLANGHVGGFVNTAQAVRPNPGIQRGLKDITETNVAFVAPGSDSKIVATVVGYQVDPRYNYRAGEFLRLSVCWKAGEPVSAPFAYSVQVVGPNNVRPATRNSFHGLGTFPMTAWTPGEVFCDPVAMRILDNVDRPRAYRLQVTLFPPDASESPLKAVDRDGRTVTPFIGSLRVAPRAQAAPPDRIAVFGDLAILAQVNTSVTADNTLSATLVWVAKGSIPGDHAVFAHVVDRASGQMAAQSDHTPDAGWFPTQFWQPGDVIVDSFRLPLPPGARLDNLQLSVGLYRRDTGQRLVATDARTGARFANDAFVVSP